MLSQKNPLISIVLATYNGEKYLEQQLESVFNQTYSNLEVIVVDDRSQDNTLEILNRYARQYANMKVVVNEVNLGYIKNFEKGCLLSTGDFIALCDQDDVWHKNKLTLLAEAIGTHPMIYCNSILCNEDMQSTAVLSDRAVLMPIESCLQEAIFSRIYGNATLFRRSLFEKAIPFLEVIPHDWWLCYVATLNGGIQYLDNPLVYYRQHSSNLVGAVGSRSRKQVTQHSIIEKKRLEINKIRSRINAFFEKCPDSRKKEKEILRALKKSYSSFSLSNNLMRMIIFLKHGNVLLAVKKRSALRKFLFCFKMFAVIK